MVAVVQTPATSKRRRSVEQPSAAALQLAGLLHVMQLLGAEEADAAAAPAPTPGAAPPERPLSPALVDHIVDALHGRSVTICAQRQAPAASKYEYAMSRGQEKNMRKVARQSTVYVGCLVMSLLCSTRLQSGCCVRKQCYPSQRGWQGRGCRADAWACCARGKGTRGGASFRNPALTPLPTNEFGAVRSVPVLGEWKMLADALLDDGACEARGEAATTNLVLLLSAAARAATRAAGEGPSAGGGPGVDGRKPAAGKAKAAAAAAAAARQDMTLALGQALPALLRKFQSDAVRVRALTCGRVAA